MRNPGNVIRKVLKPLVKRVDAWVDKDEVVEAGETSAPVRPKRTPEMPLVDKSKIHYPWSGESPVAKLPYRGLVPSASARIRAEINHRPAAEAETSNSSAEVERSLDRGLDLER